ncbi:hypothetical protein [Maridesulfovibrio bastinii]|uniref:hypothetical protein n=1 Tax=Maridesulfovibrio bastinii TaxID=47157 RepID=UPI0004039C93|nr:hypothetical protein [Maridesulfovibrio bastinii]
MFLIKKNLIIVFAVLAVILVTFGPARAFFPSDEEISSSVHSSYARFDSYEAQITFPDYPGQTLNISADHSRWRQDWTVQYSENATTTSAVGVLLDVDRVCPEGAAFPVPLIQLWLPQDPVQDWMSLGVNNATRSYGFSDDTPVLVFGAEIGDDASPQVWLSNENYAPIKIIFNSMNGKTELDFGSYKRIGGFELPESGNIVSAGNKVAFQIKWISVNKHLDPSIFSEDSIENSSCILPEGEPFYTFRSSLRLKN